MRATVFRTTFSRNVLLFLRLEFFFPTPNFFRVVFVPASFANVLSFLRPLTTSSNSWSSDFKQICSTSFCSWDYKFFNKEYCSFHKSLCKSSKTPSTLSCMSSKNVGNQLNFEQPIRMEFKSIMIIRNLAEQENISCISY